MKLWSEIDKLAQEPLAPEDVEQIRGNDYIKGHVAIRHANAVFGLGNWNCDAVGHCEIREAGGRYIVYQTVTVRATGICDNTGSPKTASFTDTGCCPVPMDKVEGWDTALKGAVTDGMKRALRNFGNQFGLGLYFGEGAEAAPKPKYVPKREARPEFQAIQLAASLAKTHEELDSCYRDNLESMKQLPTDWQPHIKEVFASHRERLNKEVGPKS